MTRKAGQAGERARRESAARAASKKSSGKQQAAATKTPRNTKTRATPSAHAPHESLPPVPFLFFGGKGGVGKTTAAAAAALALLDAAAPGERILLFSTDPAHSLSDSLGVPVGDRLVEVARRKNSRRAEAPRLYAREMDAARALAEFKARHRAVLAEIADRGTLLDEADINELLDLSLPGMDEVMSLFEMSELVRAGRYARVVVDTAPSGHTSRLLRLPAVFAHWIGALDRLNEKHRYMLSHFVRGAGARADGVEAFLRDLSARVAAVREMLFDPARSAFTLVAIPEAMSVEETARYLGLLTAEGVPVTGLLVNRVEHAHGGCPFCLSRARAQSPWLSRLEQLAGALRTHRVPLLPREVRGPEHLRRFAQLAWGDEGESKKAKGESAGSGERQAVSDRREAVFNPPLATRRSPLPFDFSERRLLIFGGKGGVGKTTAAAAAALGLAEGDASRRVLVFSTDPAHSLSDSFDERVGALKEGVAGAANLDAMEIDPAGRFEELKERYRRWTDELFESLTAGSRWEVKFDREAMRDLVALAPPGIDEIAALSAVSDLVDRDAYSTIVLDTAPTGHLVRFLELPEVALSWVRTFIRLMLKYKGVVRYGDVAEELVALSKSIRRVAALLTDPELCEFVGVAIPERMSLEETARLAGSLGRLRVPMRRLLVNNVVPAGAARACGFCAGRRRGQAQVLKSFAEGRAGAVELFAAPQQPHDIHGPAELRAHLARWRRFD